MVSATQCNMLRAIRSGSAGVPRHAPATRYGLVTLYMYTNQELVVSLALSRLDYGNATLAGLTANLLSQLQAVMNAGAQIDAGARLIFNANRREHVTPLHWLRVPERITFKLAILMFQRQRDCSWLPT